MDEKVMFLCFTVFAFGWPAALPGLGETGRSEDCSFLYSYAYKKAARPSRIAGAEALECPSKSNTQMVTPLYYDDRPGDSFRSRPTNGQKPRKTRVFVSLFRCQLNFPDS